MEVSKMSWADKMTKMVEEKVDVSAFVQLNLTTDEEYESHPFFGMLNSLWIECQKAVSQRSKKIILTPEENEVLRKKQTIEYFDGLSMDIKKSTNDFKEKFDWLSPEQIKTLKSKSIVLGLITMTEEMDKKMTISVSAKKTLANGRLVGNHNNYHRDEKDLVKVDGETLKVLVQFKSKKNENTCVPCGVIPTTTLTKGWTFDELDNCKSVERAEKGYDQVFIKPMVIPSNPTHIEGRCPIATSLNKKIQLHAMEERLREDGMTQYTPKIFDSIPRFCCNGPLANGMVCKKHQKTRDNKRWDEDDLNGWVPKQYSV